MKQFAVVLLASAVLFTCAAAENIMQDWKPHGEFTGMVVERDEKYIYALEYGDAGWGYEPPFCTSVFELEGTLLFSIDAELMRFSDELNDRQYSGLEAGYGVAHFNDGSYAVIAGTGEILLDGLEEVTGISDGYIYYRRSIGIPFLGSMLKKQGIFVGICGRSDFEGNRLEKLGVRMYAPDEMGYMRVLQWGNDGWMSDINRYGYIKPDGEYVIPPVYMYAHPFVNGAAVVRQDEAYFMIDPEGRQIGDLRWEWTADSFSLEIFEFPLVPVEEEKSVRVYDRSGRLANEKYFASAEAVVGEGKYLLCKGLDGKIYIMDEDGECLWSESAKACMWEDASESMD